MDVLTTWESTYVARCAALGLSLIALTLVAWFPGHNAARRAHSSPAGVRAGAWGLVLGTAWLIVGGWEPMTLMPGFVTLWVAIAVWSYGRHSLQQDATVPGGFEVTLINPVSQTSPANVPTLAHAT